MFCVITWLRRDRDRRGAGVMRREETQLLHQTHPTSEKLFALWHSSSLCCLFCTGDILIVRVLIICRGQCAQMGLSDCFVDTRPGQVRHTAHAQIREKCKQRWRDATNHLHLILYGCWVAFARNTIKRRRNKYYDSLIFTIRSSVCHSWPIRGADPDQVTRQDVVYAG